jgi:hypothetical protein
MRNHLISCALALLILAPGCGGGEASDPPDGALDVPVPETLAGDTVYAGVTPPGTVTYTEPREPCADRNPWRNVYWGDLHGHTGYSWDARGYDTLVSPEDAWSFARGNPVSLAPHVDGAGTRTVALERPLDFAALTDHFEFLGETAICTDPTAAGYGSEECVAFRDPVENGAYLFGILLSEADPGRYDAVCGDGWTRCLEAAVQRWADLLAATEDAYDRTAACGFTAFPAYEYTNTLDVANLHRNVLFRSGVVPALPPCYFDAPTPEQLWEQLDAACDPAEGCDVMVIPHNANLSNGNMFWVDPEDPRPEEEQRRILELRARMEPLAEIAQHKGDGECRNGLSGIGGDPDPACDFEKLRPATHPDCGETTGMGGMRLWGCVHRLDFLRNVLKEGLRIEARTGVNPYRLGFIGSTDTHNGTPGYVDDLDFQGHVGLVDDTPEKRLGPGTITHHGIIYNPGGLAGTWAVENSRDAIFDALRRREVFGTSGPRIPVRFFGGWGYDAAVCDDAAALPEAGYRGGVPMGGVLPPAGGAAAPVFVLHAAADEGTDAHPGAQLQQLHVIKGWIDGDGAVHEEVFTVAGDPDNGAAVDVETCVATGAGAAALCAVWTDPDFDPAVPAFYYLRVLEDPVCRWSTKKCNAFPAGERPPLCDEEELPRKTVQHRAWSSPIWYVP